MAHSLDYILFFRLNRADHQHITWCFVFGDVRIIKIIGCAFTQNNRREWTERFAELDFRVDDFFHGFAAWVGQDTAVAQCAWAPFKPPLEEADDFLPSK